MKTSEIHKAGIPVLLCILLTSAAVYAEDVQKPDEAVAARMMEVEKAIEAELLQSAPVTASRGDGKVEEGAKALPVSKVAKTAVEPKAETKVQSQEKAQIEVKIHPEKKLSSEEYSPERMKELQVELAAAKARISTMAGSGSGTKLKDLERKAFEYDLLNMRISAKNERIAALELDLKTAQKAITNQTSEITSLTQHTNELSKAVEKLKEEKTLIKESLDILRLGKYEYYTVEKGDTIDSIAAKPSIYGDPAKSGLIRQANKGNGMNLDQLVPGETLVIPRITASEKHDI